MRGKRCAEEFRIEALRLVRIEVPRLHPLPRDCRSAHISLVCRLYIFLVRSELPNGPVSG